MSIKVIGGQRELNPKHLFIVRVDGFDDVGFQKCSELSQETAKIEYWEGGSNIAWKAPGRTTFTDITLERGTSTDLAFHDWARMVCNAAAGAFPTRAPGTALAEVGDYRRGIDIIQLDYAQKELFTWRLTNAFPIKYVAGDWDATTDEVTVEALTITFDYFSIVGRTL